MSSTARQNDLGLNRGLFAMISAYAILGLLVMAGCLNGNAGGNGNGGTNGQLDPFDDSESPVLLSVSSEDGGERITFMGEKNSQGSWSRATGALYESATGDTFAVFVGTDGRPTEAVANGVVFRLSNWTSSSVQLTVIDRGGDASSATIQLPDSLKGAPPKPRDLQQRSMGDTLRAISDAISVVGCVVEIAKGVAVASTGAGVPVAAGIIALGCDSTLAMILGTELPPGYAEAKCAISIGSGFTISSTACITVALDHAADYFDAEDAVADAEGGDDSDGDGVPDDEDGCPNDAAKTSPGACGCGNADTDSDGDGTPNCNDDCPNDPDKTSPGECGCGEPEAVGCGSTAGMIIGWGVNDNGQCDVPAPNTDFVALAAGYSHSLGLKSDGSIVGWGGDNHYGQCDVPSPNTQFIAIAAGGGFSLGLKSDGTIVTWGYNDHGECDVPAPNTDFVAISAGSRHSLGLKTDGSIVAWEYDYSGQCDVPAPNTDFVAIAAKSSHSLGLKADGSIVAWGRNYYGEGTPPSPNTGFVSIAAGMWHNLGLKSDGSIVAWGSNLEGPCDVPSPNTGFAAVMASTATYSCSLGLKNDGSIVAWGNNYYGQCDVPSPNTRFVAIAGGDGFSLGLKGD